MSPEIEFFQSGGYEALPARSPSIERPDMISNRLHQKQPARENQNQWERDLAGIIESHCRTSITILTGHGIEFSRFFGESRSATGERRARQVEGHIYAFMLT